MDESGRDPQVVVDALVAAALFVLTPQLVLPLLGEPSTELVAGVERASILMAVGILAVVAFAVIRRRPALRPRLVLLGAYPVFLLPWIGFAMLLYPWIMRCFGGELTAQDPLQYYAVAEPWSSAKYALVLLCTVIGAPIAEEILFRGFLFRWVESKTSAYGALLITSVLFGLVHGVEFAVPITLLGGFFGWLRMRTGGVATSILAHMVHNGWTVAVVVTWPELVSTIYDKG